MEILFAVFIGAALVFGWYHRDKVKALIARFRSGGGG